jgi:polyhydroxybutyrate depolymerase
MSNGAIMSHRLACDLAGRIAAIGPVAGTIMRSPCTPSRPVPVMEIHGSDDKNVPWEGGMGCGVASVPFTSVPDTIAGWLTRNGCTTAPPSLLVAQGDGRCEIQGACAAGAEVVLCTVQGGGHAWPGGGPREVVSPACQQAGAGAQSTTFVASEQLWNFFRSHVLGQ